MTNVFWQITCRSVDFFTVHTIWFETLFVFVVLAHHRRRILHFNVTVENTLIVVSGDHGMPGITNGKCNLYDFGTGVALAARLPKGMGARRGSAVDSLISLPNLAPTFLEAVGVALPVVNSQN